MVNGLIGQNGKIVLLSVVVAIKHAQEAVLILSLNLMALIAMERILKHKFAMMNLVK